MADKPKKDDASAQAVKVQRAEDARKAMSDYEADAVAVRAKTERLKALRLARDAAMPPKAPAAPKKSVGKKKASKANADATLAEWLDDQGKEGRRS
jgi:hypothetical protein